MCSKAFFFNSMVKCIYIDRELDTMCIRIHKLNIKIHSFHKAFYSKHFFYRPTYFSLPYLFAQQRVRHSICNLCPKNWFAYLMLSRLSFTFHRDAPLVLAGWFSVCFNVLFAIENNVYIFALRMRWFVLIMNVRPCLKQHIHETTLCSLCG